MLIKVIPYPNLAQLATKAEINNNSFIFINLNTIMLFVINLI